MAGKNQVVLTFAGESKQLEDTIDKVGAKSRQMEDDVGRASERIGGLGDNADRARPRVSNYGDGLDGVGERADELDTRMMGLSDGIQGTTDLMRAGELAPHELAMAFADLGSAAYNTVVPSIKGVGDSVKGMADRIKSSGGVTAMLRRNMVGIGAVALGAGAGIALLTMHFQDQAAAEARAEARVDAYVDKLKELRGDTDALTRSLVTQDAEYATLRKALAASEMTAGDFNQAIKDGTLDLDAMSDAAGLSKGETFQLMLEVGRLTGGVKKAGDELGDMEAVTGDAATQQKNLADEIRGVSDAMAAQTDPAFAYLDAQRQMRDANREIEEAQRAVTDAVNEFGEGSPEAVAAQEAVRDAHLDAAAAASGQDQALSDLAVEMTEQGYSVDDIIAHFQAMVGQNGLTQASVDTLAAALRNVPEDVRSKITVTVEEIVNRIQTTFFDWKGPKFHSGGVMPGAPGTEGLALLQAGERVTPAGQSAGGGTTVHVHAQGSILSERDIVRVVREAVGRGDLRGAA